MPASGRGHTSGVPDLAPPHALAGTVWDGPAAVLLIAFLAALFVIEILTPNVAVGAFVLLPLLAGMWLLSNRSATLVAVVAGVLFMLSVVAEASNRMTLLIIGVTILATTVLVRLHARALGAGTVKGSELAGLTKRELEVARLAVQAYTAAEIGTRLHIGERTVETHLTNIYTKLRIGSRRELIRTASRLEP